MDMKNIFVILLLFSCKESERERIFRIVSAWQGKEIIFPEKMTFTYFGKDTLNYTIPESEYKILVYIDSIGCTSCKLKLDVWKNFIKQLDSTTHKDTPVLLFFHPKKVKEIQRILVDNEFDYPVCIDMNDSLNILNGFLPYMALQVFLIDKENKVKVIGSPFHSDGVKKLYLDILGTKQYEEKKFVETSAIVECSKIDLGTFLSGEKKEAIFYLKNVGTSPLVILDIKTTCGCTIVKYDEHPVSAGETLKVMVQIMPQMQGAFEEPVTVKCNASSSPFKLVIKGHVNNK